jgi:hypothetical protein
MQNKLVSPPYLSEGALLRLSRSVKRGADGRAARSARRLPARRVASRSPVGNAVACSSLRRDKAPTGGERDPRPAARGVPQGRPTAVGLKPAIACKRAHTPCPRTRSTGRIHVPIPCLRSLRAKGKVMQCG